MRILLVEDDEKLCNMLLMRLKENKIQCDLCLDGGDANEYMKRDAYDVIVLDRMLPHKDGLTILEEMRAQGNETPVIMVTALGQLTHRVEGLNSGADDYLTKPFEVEEFIARVRALGRRKNKAMSGKTIRYGDFEYDEDRMCIVSIESPDQVCRLSKREAELLSFFLMNRDRILTRELIMDRVWGVDNDTMDSNLDNFISFLRKRLRSIKSNCKIKTVRGVGYQIKQE